MYAAEGAPQNMHACSRTSLLHQGRIHVCMYVTLHTTVVSFELFAAFSSATASCRRFLSRATIATTLACFFTSILGTGRKGRRGGMHIDGMVYMYMNMHAAFRVTGVYDLSTPVHRDSSERNMRQTNNCNTNIYTRIHTYTRIYALTYTYTQIYMHVCIGIDLITYLLICICIYMNIDIYLYLYFRPYLL